MPTPSRTLLAAALLAAALAALPALSAQAAGDPLAAHRWKSRVVVALAPSPDDPALAAQRRIFAALGSEARERDLVLLAATDGTAAGDALRRRFGGGPGFRAILVGKDGGEKLSSAVPLGRESLLPLIDAMPMRQDEMSRRR